MFEVLYKWYKRRFSDPQAMGLFFILLFSVLVLYFFSSLITPILIAIVLAYLLDWPVNFLHKSLKIPHLLSVIIILTLSIGIVVFLLLVLLPSLWEQVIRLISDMPRMIDQIKTFLLSLPENYPDVIDYQSVYGLFNNYSGKVITVAQSALKLSLSSIVNIVGLGIYAFLVPLMTFFLLKDKDELAQSFSRFLPKDRNLANQVGSEMKVQIANYIRSKFLEIIIVAVVSYIIFLLFGLNYALLLALIIGLSVLVPYVGAVVAAVPLALVTFYQFGLTPIFGYIMLSYVVSQILDGNVLVPILFSEAVNLHPLIIIISVIIFGGLWGFWGIFFAIPLATLIKAIVNAWPSTELEK